MPTNERLDRLNADTDVPINTHVSTSLHPGMVADHGAVLVDDRGGPGMEGYVAARSALKSLHESATAIDTAHASLLERTEVADKGGGVFDMQVPAHRRAELADSMTRFPQVLVNVEVADLEALEGSNHVWETVRAAEQTLGERGRVLVRASGTEPVVRVMVEAPTEEEAARQASAIAGAVAEALGPVGMESPA